MRTRLARLLTLLTAAVLMGAGTPARAQVPLQNRLEAAITAKLPQFVNWPPAALAGRPSATLCVASPNPFGNDLAELVRGEQIAGHPIAVRSVERREDLDGCQVLFVPTPLAPRRALLQTAAVRPILTVGDAPDFLDQGGIVRLRLVSGRMRFDINAEVASRVGLRISSQLLQLAISVRGNAS
jgi:hypothetical protein